MRKPSLCDVKHCLIRTCNPPTVILYDGVPISAPKTLCPKHLHIARTYLKEIGDTHLTIEPEDETCSTSKQRSSY